MTRDRQSTFIDGAHLSAGRSPSPDELLISALLHSNLHVVTQIAKCLDANADLDDPARRAYNAAVDLADQGTSPAPELVKDELRRTGHLDRRTACWLATAAATSAPPETARRYAASVVAASVRRQIENWGCALATAATTASETELEATVDTFAATISEAFGRLATLRAR